MLDKLLKLKFIFGIASIGILLLLKSSFVLADHASIEYQVKYSRAAVSHNKDTIRYTEVIILEGSSSNPDSATPTYYNAANIPAHTDLYVYGSPTMPYAFAKGLLHYGATPNAAVQWSKTIPI